MKQAAALVFSGFAFGGLLGLPLEAEQSPETEQSEVATASERTLVLVPQVNGDEYGVSGLADLHVAASSIWAAGSNGALQVTSDGAVVGVVTFNKERHYPGDRARFRRHPVVRVVPGIEPGEVGFVAMASRGYTSVLFNEQGRQLAYGKCGGLIEGPANLRSGQAAELVEARGGNIIVCDTQTLQRRATGRPKVKKIPKKPGDKSVLEGSAWIFDLDFADVDGDGLDELVLATEAPFTRALQYAVYSGADFRLRQKWPGSELDGLQIKTGTINGRPVVAHQTTAGVAVDEIGGNRLYDLPVSQTNQGGTVTFVGVVENIGLVVIIRLNRGSHGSLLAAYDPTTGALIQEVKVPVRVASAEVLTDSAGLSTLWVISGSELLILESTRNAPAAVLRGQ